MTIPEDLNIIDDFSITYRFGLSEQRVWYYRTEKGYYRTDANVCDDFKPKRIKKSKFEEAKKLKNSTVSTRIC